MSFLAVAADNPDNAVNGSRPDTVPSVGAILLAVVLLTANAAWCQSGMLTTPKATKGWGSVEPVSVQRMEVGIRHVVEAGVRMALTREAFEDIWPKYAYKIDPSDNLNSACGILRRMPEQHRQNAIILKSSVDFSNAGLNDELRGFGLKALGVCNSRERERELFGVVWPSYAYEFDPTSDNLDSIHQFLDGMQFALDPIILSGDSDFGNVGFSAEFQRFEMNALISEDLNDAEHNYLVTGNPVPSLELSAQIWQPWEQDSYDYLVTGNPVPSLELSARVQPWEQDSYDYLVMGNPVPSSEKLGDWVIPNFIIE